MADTVVHMGENSPEQVAYKLFQLVANVEKKKIVGPDTNADREWILKTYSDCFRVVQGVQPEHL